MVRCRKTRKRDNLAIPTPAPIGPSHYKIIDLRLSNGAIVGDQVLNFLLKPRVANDTLEGNREVQ